MHVVCPLLRGYDDNSAAQNQFDTRFTPAMGDRYNAVPLTFLHLGRRRTLHRELRSGIACGRTSEWQVKQLLWHASHLSPNHTLRQNLGQQSVHVHTSISVSSVLGFRGGDGTTQDVTCRLKQTDAMMSWGLTSQTSSISSKDWDASAT